MFVDLVVANTRELCKNIDENVVKIKMQMLVCTYTTFDVVEMVVIIQ